MIYNEYEKMIKLVCDTFSANLKENTLDFLLFLNNNVVFERISGYWKNQFYWAVKYNNEYVCYILINGVGDEARLAPLTIWTDDSGSNWYEDYYQISDGLKNCAWDNVDYCVHCGSCKGGTPKVIFGRKFNNICRTTMRFTNPNKQTFQFIKELIRIRKCDIENKLKEQNNVEI